MKKLLTLLFRKYPNWVIVKTDSESEKMQLVALLAAAGGKLIYKQKEKK